MCRFARSPWLCCSPCLSLSSPPRPPVCPLLCVLPPAHLNLLPLDVEDLPLNPPPFHLSRLGGPQPPPPPFLFPGHPARAPLSQTPPRTDCGGRELSPPQQRCTLSSPRVFTPTGFSLPTTPPLPPLSRSFPPPFVPPPHHHPFPRHHRTVLTHSPPRVGTSHQPCFRVWLRCPRPSPLLLSGSLATYHPPRPPLCPLHTTFSFTPGPRPCAYRRVGDASCCCMLRCGSLPIDGLAALRGVARRRRLEDIGSVRVGLSSDCTLGGALVAAKV